MPGTLGRNTRTFALNKAQIEQIKRKMPDWGQRSGIFLYLDSSGYTSRYQGYSCLLAVGCHQIVPSLGQEDVLSGIQHHHDKHRDWLFGHLAYEFKDTLMPGLQSTKPSTSGFPDYYFFHPETVCYIDQAETSLTIATIGDPEAIFLDLNNANEPSQGLPDVRFLHSVDKQSYLATINALREHIAAGDCYEINYCTKASAQHIDLDPASVFSALNRLSPAPFAAFYGLNDSYMMCASPERYIKKEGPKIISQPIKGTARRSTDPKTDEQIKAQLRNSIKEQAENVMITDLVRNDLARSCRPGTVAVDELFGIYTYPHVHQMTSTISGQLSDSTPFTDALRFSFPMGSMTGAPKYQVMQLIEQYEVSRRELFSGTVGYIDPNGGFDFNVVIRSLFYNAANKYLSYSTGGAITYESSPEAEWDEMRLKAYALEKIFATNQ